MPLRIYGSFDPCTNFLDLSTGSVLICAEMCSSGD